MPSHKPALLTGTSTEFLGARPLPKVLGRRAVVFLFGPKGVGKTEVAMRLAGSNAVYWSARAIERAVLQRVRDESHRFAVAYHRQLRSRRMTGSVLDGIAGLGPARRKRLVKEMGGVRAVQGATLADLREMTWLPDAVASAVYAKVHRDQ